MTTIRKVPSDFSEYGEIMMRRKWWLLIPAVTISIAAFLFGLFLPRSYRSEAVILVESQNVPASYVQPTIAADVADRLQAMSQEILGQGRLQGIINEFGLYENSRGRLSSERIVDLMRKDIIVTVANEPNADKSIGSLKIAYTGSTPRLAQQVTRRLASLFIEENLNARQQQAEKTTDFINSQLEKARLTLDVEQKKLNQFRAAHTGELPEQEAATLQLISQSQGLIQSNMDALLRANDQLKEKQLQLDKLSNLPPENPTGLQAQLDAKRAELIAVKQRYAPTHPDVIRLQSELTALEAVAKEERKTRPPADARTGETAAQIEGELDSLRKEIATRSARQSQIETQIRLLQSRVVSLPQVEGQIAEISRDYETSKSNYDQLLAKSNASAMATELEKRNESEPFRVISPANLPAKPFKPNLLELDGMGVACGIIVGLGLAFLIEHEDHSIHSANDWADHFTVPVLASFPLVLTAEERRTKRNRSLIAFTAALAVLIGLAVTVFYCQPAVLGSI
jgi:polysaccharide chain length determinant protein (PEP-CTERM system associated)